MTTQRKTLRYILKRVLYWRHSPVIVGLVLAHLVFLAIFGLHSSGKLEGLDLVSYDWMLTQRAQTNELDNRITMVWLTDEDQRRFGWPLTDANLVQAFEILLANQPRVIGLDLYRDLPVPINKQPAYDRLCQIFKQNKQIIGIEKIADSNGVHVSPSSCLSTQDQVGFNDLIVDQGGTIRRGLFFMTEENGQTVWSFSLRLALKYLEKDEIHLHGRTDSNDGFLGDGILPRALTENFGGYVDIDSAGYQFLMAYPNAPRDFNHLTFTQLLTGNFDPRLLQDKIVIVGTRAEATPDFFYTPIDNQRIAGASIHAYATSQLLNISRGKDDALRSWTEAQEMLWIWMWVVLGVMTCLFVAQTAFDYVALMFGGLVALTFIVYTSFMMGWWLLLAPPALGWVVSMIVTVAYRSYQQSDERKILMSLFRSHVSKDVAEIIWQSRDQYLHQGRLRPKRATATVLFTDIKGFTSVSESMEPDQLMDWLNEYMDAMVHIVEKHQGQVNKFIGDAIMATFGMPIVECNEKVIERDAVNAVECALAMRQEIIELSEQWKQYNLPEVKVRIGIYTGPLVVGSLGSSKRQEYTVLGDTVNTAARLEGFNKEWDMANPCRILIGETTLKYLGDGYQTQYVGTVNLRGKTSPVTVYQVQDKKNSFVTERSFNTTVSDVFV
ncbi:adenylate/guanylate cyclase domain-containing protein [Candidatus Albibeggiatoa sp. nov. NOAA]|uniref:CHASE2 domain-containing protein n=1 Tax=Candidatus Albibeggiatoa sp. nov. NOAA TaxID=3162724 RepID=UPI0032FFBD02|nr:adenylate/guanylate cyclase domain-containing protein [Thiotrichaceae bacterium]